ncbi:DNA-directed RNA polymerase, mitochondrial isoform X2 [Hyalella azteca]|uniref:DNA-directed RNA polymerase n=1 Tax=Hyalella azteca TaxID=294128 RepID=A0A8B7PHN6_HYAAZ|nr:DNA-directed RNA polymerase, mitochondrial isoform X2 [Hyalella azteca]
MLSLLELCLIPPRVIIPRSFVRYYCSKHAPANLLKQPATAAAEIYGSSATSLNKPHRPKRRKTKLKLTLIEVGSLSVSELHPKATRINKRTLKDAMLKISNNSSLQPNILQKKGSLSYEDNCKESSSENLIRVNDISRNASTQVRNTNKAESSKKEAESISCDSSYPKITSIENENSAIKQIQMDKIYINQLPSIKKKCKQKKASKKLSPVGPCSSQHAVNSSNGNHEDNLASSSSLAIKNKDSEDVLQNAVKATKSKKKCHKSKEKNLDRIEKQVQALRKQQRNFRFNRELEAYLSVCVTAGMYNRACHTLAHYRHTKGTILTSVTAYNIVMAGQYTAGHFMRVVQLDSWLKDSGLSPTACTYALHISALHKMAQNYSSDSINPGSPLPCHQNGKAIEESISSFNDPGSLSLNKLHVPDNCVIKFIQTSNSRYGVTSEKDMTMIKQKISAVLDQMLQQGLTLDHLFAEANFLGDLYTATLAGVRRVHPHYSPSPIRRHDTPGYTCPLLENANDHMDYTSSLKSNDNLSSANMGSSKLFVPSPEDVEEQFAMEAHGVATIPSVHSMVHNPYLKKKLDVWQGRWRKALLEAYTTEVEKLRKKFFADDLDKNICLYPYLMILSPEQMVQIMMQEIHTIAGGSEGNSPSLNFLYYRISQTVFGLFSFKYKEDIGLLGKFKKIYAEYLKIYGDHAERGLNGRVAMEQLCELHPEGPRLTHRPPDWPFFTRLELGKFLYTLIIRNIFVWHPINTEKRKLPAMQEVDRVCGYNNVLELRAHSLLCQLYRETNELSFFPTELPMTCPPRPWVTCETGGNLVLPNSMVRRPPNSHHYNEKVRSTPTEQLRPCMDSLNNLSCTPWRVNAPMLDVISEVFNSNSGAELDVPQHPSALTKPAPLPPKPSANERARHNSMMLDYFKKKNEMHSLWCSALYKISMASHFRDRVFWFPHNVDFRGRAYPCPPHFSHFDSDLFRSLLHFAIPKPLGKVGLDWLKTHVINLTGFQKQNSLSARLEYCESVLPEIFDSAERPLTGNRWWTTSDEPWQTLAACKELHAALHSPDPEGFMSRLPIHQDGSCNGLQHYAALGRDVEGATSVNLAPSPVPQDVYTAVANLVEKMRASDAADPASKNHAIARTLEGFIKRKVVKQTVMTTVYGVTRYGSILQIDKQLKELEGFPPESRSAASRYLSDATFRSLEMMFMATKEIQDWFTDCATLISKVCGQSVEWVTPLGLPIVQPYHKPSSSAQVQKLHASSITSLDNLYAPNSVKQRNAFPPNFIHSLDACHMMLTALYCHRHHLTFASVHDCYWTHASTVDTMSKICRDQFVALHSQPILSDLSKFMCQRYGFPYENFTHDGSAADGARLRVNSTLEAIPKLGDFDIELVKQSKFFFS